MAILVSGGAGYIGSHTCIELLNAGYDVVVADNYYNASPVVLDRVKQITGKDFRFYNADMTRHEDVEKIITEYTRESGVRSLDKNLAKIARARAKNIAFDEPYQPEITAEDVVKILGKPIFRKDEYEIGGMIGVVTGLAWTSVGGEILYIESVLTPGKGGLSLTGNLGDVMKESATIAYEKSEAKRS